MYKIFVRKHRNSYENQNTKLILKRNLLLSC